MLEGRRGSAESKLYVPRVFDTPNVSAKKFRSPRGTLRRLYSEPAVLLLLQQLALFRVIINT